MKYKNLDAVLLNIFCQHAALRSKSKDLLARNQDNVS